MQSLPLYLPIYSVISSSADRLRLFHELVVEGLVVKGLRTAYVRAIIETPGANRRGESEWFTQVSHSVPVYSFTGTKEALVYRLSTLARNIDLLLIENDKELGLPLMLLDGKGAGSAADAVDLATFDLDRQAAVRCVLEELEKRLAARPVWACILMGGRSSRMGRPKHLLPAESGSTWLERTVHTVQPQVEGVVLSGRGEIPAGLHSLSRLTDIPNVGGPLAGILSAIRWQPDVSWLFLACDMPEVTAEAVAWLLGERKIGQWATVPTRGGLELVEPLFARYEPQCTALFEQMWLTGTRRIRRIVDFEKINVVRIPVHLQGSWQNINTPEELYRVLPSSSPSDS